MRELSEPYLNHMQYLNHLNRVLQSAPDEDVMPNAHLCRAAGRKQPADGLQQLVVQDLRDIAKRASMDWTLAGCRPS